MPRTNSRAPEEMITRGRRLRWDATVPERLLWGRFRHARCGGWKFRRQHPLGPYVADFFCASARVVVELDGHGHDGQERYDRRREEHLHRQGLEGNDRVLADLDAVVETIAAVCAGELVREGNGLSQARSAGTIAPGKTA